MSVAFVGGGNMAVALIGGLIARGRRPDEIHVAEPSEDARVRLSERFGVQVCADAAELPVTATVLLAVKPQQMRAVARVVASRLRPEQLVVSIAAGIRLQDLRDWLGGHANLVRCMPNTPALIGAGISGIYAAPSVDDVRRQTAEDILSAVGEVVWVGQEALLDAVTAVSGSGPAYVFYFMEAVEAAAQRLGLAPETARALVLQTFSGAAALAAQSEEAPERLRARVTSKGGTTEAALRSLDDAGVRAAIEAAVEAACTRAKELGDELGSA